MGGGATGVLGSRGDGRRGYKGSWGAGVTGGGATGVLGSRGDGRRGYRGLGEQG